MKIDVGRDGRCNLHLEGADDPAFVGIYRNGVLVSEVACSMVSDSETLRSEVEIARRLERWPRLLHTILATIASNYAGMPDDPLLKDKGPDGRRKAYTEGFLAALCGDIRSEPQSQSWLMGFSDGESIIGETNALMMAKRDRAGHPVK
jgi:hypothetical protein